MKSYVYRITNLVENRHYYGSRKSKHESLMTDLKLYKSSFKQWFREDQIKNPQNYKYKIIKVFDDRKEAFKFEGKLHSFFDVKNNPKFYNLANQTSDGFSTEGQVAVYDFETKSNKLVSTSDPSYLSGELVSINVGKVAVKDKKGNRFQVDADDPRYVSGELVSVIKGYKINKKKINIYDDKGELQFETCGTFKEVCKNNNLPFTALFNSYRKNGEKIYQKIGSNYNRLKKSGKLQFVGWYALIAS